MRLNVVAIPGLKYKPQLGQVAWWQQTSTDMSSDQEAEAELGLGAE